MKMPIHLLFTAAVAMAVSLAAQPSVAAAPAATDAATVECAGCHETYLKPGATSRVSHASGAEHSLGVDYASAAARTAALAPPADLPRAMALPGGRVGCTTCHVPYSAADHETLAAERSRIPEIPDPLLSVDNAGSALCLACHRK